jgi:uncharacterized repeat protein (TIGR01451 family)
MMKRLHQVLGLGAIAVALATPVLFSTPVWAELQRAGATVAQNLQREPQMQLNLSAQKQVTTTDEKGQPEMTWQALSGQAVVSPGDVLRYSLNGQNTSDRPVRNLAITQPIPNQMKYVLESATINQDTDAEITYSIDGGKTFVARPTVEVRLPDGTVENRPAPAEMYSHVRWNFGDAISTDTMLNATYQVAVQ